jgi:hypothetical protein
MSYTLSQEMCNLHLYISRLRKQYVLVDENQKLFASCTFLEKYATNK